MKHEKSRQKHNCQSVLKQLKHVVNVSHGQKPYLDYSCKVDVSFFSLFFYFSKMVLSSGEIEIQ